MCLLSELMDVCIKSVEFRENIRAIPKDKENCLL